MKKKPERSLHALPRRKRNHVYCIYNTLTCTGDTGSTYTGTLSITSCKSLGSPKQIADVSIKKTTRLSRLDVGSQSTVKSFIQ